MVVTELDSFVLKFKNLCLARNNANLTMKTIAGKVTVCLQVELDGLPLHTQLPLKTRNGPSQQNPREKRAIARKVVAEKAAAEVTPEEAAVLILAEEAVIVATAGSAVPRIVVSKILLRKY